MAEPRSDKTTAFWTDGSSEGAHCHEEGTFSWCSKGETFSLLSNNFSAGNVSAQNCLIMNISEMTVKLERSHCETAQTVICEVFIDQKWKKIISNNQIIMPKHNFVKMEGQ
jgi:hypothetical protein